MSANKSATNLDRLLDQRHITYVQFSGMLASVGYHITPKQVVRSIGAFRGAHMTRKHITPELITAAARVLDVPESAITGDHEQDPV